MRASGSATFTKSEQRLVHLYNGDNGERACSQNTKILKKERKNEYKIGRKKKQRNTDKHTNNVTN